MVRWSPAVRPFNGKILANLQTVYGNIFILWTKLKMIITTLKKKKKHLTSKISYFIIL